MKTLLSAIAAAAISAALVPAAHAETGPFAPETEEIDIAAQAFARVRWGAANASDPQRFTYGLAVRSSESCGASLATDPNRTCFAAPTRGVELRDFASGSPSLWMVGADANAFRLDAAARYQDGADEEDDGVNWTPWIIGGVVVIGLAAVAIDGFGDGIEDGIDDMFGN
jgi:hypothetical protein